MEKWKKISSKYAFNNRWMKIRQDVVELPNGKILDDYFVYEEGDVAMIVPVTADKKFVFVRQYKHASGDIMVEFPAGFIEKGEEPLEAAKRELEEETGYQSNQIEPLTKIMNSPTKISSDIYVFLGQESISLPNPTRNQDENENIELLKLSFEEAHRMIKNGEIRVSGTIVAFYLASEKLGFIKSR